MSAQGESAPGKTPTGREFAWKVHAALDTWTGRVDTKASITLAIQSASFGFVVTQSDPDKRFAELAGLSAVLYGLGLAALLLAVLLALRVVVPQLNRRKSKQNWQTNMVYFGHLRHWDPANLGNALRQEQPYEDQLARQLVEMSEIAWRKHAVLQWSLASYVAAASLLVAAALVA